MVDNQEQKRRVLCQRDHDEIRYRRYCGQTMVQIGVVMGVTYDAVRHRIRQYGLDGAVSEAEALAMELRASLRDTGLRLQAPDLSVVDHGRLCATQVRLAAALLRLTPQQADMEDDMSRKSDMERKRILEMTEEELRNDIRRLVGLETKAVDRADGGGDELPGDEVSQTEHVSDQSDAGPEAADGD